MCLLIPKMFKDIGKHKFFLAVVSIFYNQNLLSQGKNSNKDKRMNY